MKDMELNKVRTAFEHATPDVLDSVLSDCREQKGTIIMTEKKSNWSKKLIAAAAALVLVAGLGGGIGWYQYTSAPMADICLDVNPSIQITVNRNEKILRVDALNEDAVTVLDDIDLKGSNINVAVNAILGSMLKHNYLTVDANTVLVSVNSKEAAAGTALQEKLTAEIGQALSASNFSGAVMGQSVTGSSEIQSLSQQYGISEGKAQLIRKILAADSHYTFESLAKLSINALKLLTEKDTVHLQDVTSSGQASSSEYIGKDAAVNAALSHAKTTADQIRNLQAEFDCDDGRMLYEVEFILNGLDFEIDVDARTGKVLKLDKEHSDNIPDNDDRDFDGDNNSDNTTAKPASYISPAQAKNAALTHAGVNAANAREMECELETDDRKAHYDVNFETNDYEYEYEIDAITGKILSSDREKQDR